MSENPYTSPDPGSPRTDSVNSTGKRMLVRKFLLILLIIVSAFVLCLPRSLRPVAILLFPMGITDYWVDLYSVWPEQYMTDLFNPHYAVWGLYGCLVLAFLSISNRKVCFWLFVIMCSLVALNCLGCHFVEFHRPA